MTTFVHLDGSRVVGVFVADTDEGLPEPWAEAPSRGTWPARPSSHHEAHWDGVAVAWVDPRSLSEIRDARWGAIKADREARCGAPVSVEVGGETLTFDADDKSQTLIQGAISGMQLAGTTSVDWTLSDNTVRTLSFAELCAVGVAIVARTGACYDTARELRTAVYDPAKTTAAEVEAVTWPD